MKIAFPSDYGQINQHFGRSREFAILEMDGQKIAGRKLVSADSLQHNHQGLADLLAAEKVDVVVLGGIGPYALQALEQSGLKVITGASGDIGAAAEKFARGELVTGGTACGRHHHGPCGHQHDHGSCGHGHGGHNCK